MTDTLTPLHKVDPSEPPRRGRGPLLALAVAAVLILIIGVASFSLLNNDEAPVATDPPAPTTTVASLPESPLPADTPALEVVNRLQAAWDAGDIARAESLIWPESPYFTFDVETGISREVMYRSVTGMTAERECVLGAPPQLAERPLLVVGAEMVTCNETLTSGLEPGVEIGGGVVAAEVADGWVTDVIIVDYIGALDERAGLNNYRNWLQETIPDRYPDLFNENTLTIIVETPVAQEGHRELVPFFLADTGPRPERALPAETAMTDVVAEFHRRWDAGDVEGYEAIINPAIGYPPGNDAWAARFADVTGVTAERTCTEVDAITLRCQETATSGLLPGETTASTVDYVVRNGWILAINFVEGESALITPATAAGVSEYRLWVRDNYPDRFDTLFAVGVTMVLDTEEVRELHRQTIAEYLAATS